MNISRMYAVFLRYVFLLKGNPQRFAQLIIWGTLDVVLWGFITKYFSSVGGSSFDFAPVLIGAVILLDFLERSQQGTSTPALEDIWSNNLLNYFASPLKVGEYLGGLVAASIFTSMFSLLVMVLVASFAFEFSLLHLGAALFGFLIILFLFGISLGILGTAIVLRLGPSGEWYIWPMTALLSPFVGVFYPISVLPSWMQAISHILPPSYVFEGMRSIVLESAFDPSTLLIGIVLALFYVGLAQAFFFFMYRSVVKSGLLARHSAEGL